MSPGAPMLKPRLMLRYSRRLARRSLPTVSILALLAFACAVGGCGGGSKTTGANTDSSNGVTTRSHGETPDFSAPGEAKYALYGHEASGRERIAASEVLERNYEARAAARWATQCSSLTLAAVKRVEKADGLLGGAEGCVAALKLAAEPLKESAAARANNLNGPIDLLRVKGPQGYAVYRGNDGNDYAMPMRKVKGDWKVDSLATTQIGTQGPAR